MSVQVFRFASELPCAASDAFQWHARPGALLRLTPPWAQLRVVSTQGEGLADGSRVTLRQKVGAKWLEWEVEHRDRKEDREFRDVALRGPFAEWEHIHRFIPQGPAACVVEDEIHYRLPAGPLGKALAGAWTQRELERLFRFRHARMLQDLRMDQRYGAVRPMRFAISGASGLIGSALSVFLKTQRHEVVPLVRHRPVKPGEVYWDPMRGELDHLALKGVDAVIHLAGASIAEGRWSERRRREIKESRVQGTRTLVAAIERMRHRPFVFLSASGVGIYGDRGNEELDEESQRGTGFLADVCEAWEQEAEAVAELGLRPVMLRTGMVLSPQGGALAKLLPLYRWGLGGALGSGRQWVSWVSLDDVVGAYYHAILDQRCAHEVNLVAPEPVTNAELTQALGECVNRPAVFRIPAPFLKAAMGSMAQELLLSSTKVYPQVLKDADYRFQHVRIGDALRFLLGGPPKENRKAPGA